MQLAVLAAMADGIDGRTILNSVLGEWLSLHVAHLASRRHFHLPISAPNTYSHALPPSLCRSLCRPPFCSSAGAYGLPQLKAAAGYRLFDDPEEPYSFEYPRSWVRRNNSLRSGFVISDFNTADQLKIEVFPQPPPELPLAQAVVAKLVNPAAEVGGDSRLELPPVSRIKTEVRVIDGKVGDSSP